VKRFVSVNREPSALKGRVPKLEEPREHARSSSAMTIEAIKEARDAAPFKSFTIRTADGMSFEIPNHDCLLVAEGGKTLVVVTPDQKFHILATALVASISR
jgi:hypothetical protein